MKVQKIHYAMLCYAMLCYAMPEKALGLTYSSECSDWAKKAEESDAVFITRFEGFKNPDFDSPISEGVFTIIYALKGNTISNEIVVDGIDRIDPISNIGMSIYYAKPKDYAVMFLKKSGKLWKKNGCLSHTPLDTLSLEDKGIQKLLNLFLKR